MITSKQQIVSHLKITTNVMNVFTATTFGHNFLKIRIQRKCLVSIQKKKRNFDCFFNLCITQLHINDNIAKYEQHSDIHCYQTGNKETLMMFDSKLIKKNGYYGLLCYNTFSAKITMYSRMQSLNKRIKYVLRFPTS